eukprot:5857298-Heterocapsa_arctica.AAC.1
MPSKREWRQPMTFCGGGRLAHRRAACGVARSSIVSASMSTFVWCAMPAGQAQPQQTRSSSSSFLCNAMSTQ